MIVGTQIELVEITASIYEVGAKVWLCAYEHHEGFDIIDHAMIILPAPEQFKDEWGNIDYSPDYQNWYGEKDNHYAMFITKIPMIGLDFNHISQGISSERASYISSLDDSIGNIGISDTYHDFVPDILNEVNADIDKHLHLLPMKNMWKEESKVHVFRFIVALQTTHESHYDYYYGGTEYDSYIEWLGRIDIRDIERNIKTEEKIR